MPEIVKSFVPRLPANPPHALGTKSHAVLVTDARTILLPWRDAKILLGSFLDGGVILASGFADSEQVFDPEMWVRRPGAVVISHGFVDGLRCRRTLNTYSFVVEFRQDEEPEKISGGGSKQAFGLRLPRMHTRRKQEGFSTMSRPWEGSLSGVSRTEIPLGLDSGNLVGDFPGN